MVSYQAVRTKNGPRRAMSIRYLNDIAPKGPFLFYPDMLLIDSDQFNIKDKQ